jgi:hypothetical protein
MAEDAVGNQLLERRILFHLGPRPVAHMLGLQQLGQVPRRVGAKSLKVPEPLKDRRRHDQHLFCEYL